MNVVEEIKTLLMQKGFGVEGATIAAEHLVANGVMWNKHDLCEDNMYKLKRCPICGGVAAITKTDTVYSHNRNHNEYEYRYQIRCQNCGLTTKSVTVQFGYSISMGAWADTDELDKLVSTWNNREGV